MVIYRVQGSVPPKPLSLKLHILNPEPLIFLVAELVTLNLLVYIGIYSPTRIQRLTFFWPRVLGSVRRVRVWGLGFGFFFERGGVGGGFQV